MQYSFHNIYTRSFSDVFEDKGLEFFLSTMEESRGLVYLRENGGVVYFITRKKVIVMEIGTGKEVDPFISDGFVVVFKGHGIGPCLIRRMGNIPVGPAEKSIHILFVFHHNCVLPLFQLHNDHIVMVLVIQSCNDEIYSMAAIGELVFNTDCGIIIYLRCHDYRSHESKGIIPSLDFAFIGFPQNILKIGFHSIADPSFHTVIYEVSLSSLVDDHTIPPYGIY